MNTKKNYFDVEAEMNPLWGSFREKLLSETIWTHLPKKFTSLLDVGCGDGVPISQIKKKMRNKKIIYNGIRRIISFSS
jgi:2-polyprenyl-3-methyl-5-hydroxy-6-metoxy-1,4-benzoquinol methylase